MLRIQYRNLLDFEIADEPSKEIYFLFGVRKSGSSMSWSNNPPFAWGLALIRLVPTGASALRSARSIPELSNSSSA